MNPFTRLKKPAVLLNLFLANGIDHGTPHMCDPPINQYLLHHPTADASHRHPTAGMTGTFG
jgi:hypothetical protein